MPRIKRVCSFFNVRKWWGCGWQEREVVGEQGIEKSETGEGAWTRSHAGCFAAPLPLLEGAGSEFSAETYMGRMDRATWIDRSILDVRNCCPWMGRSEFKHDDPERGRDECDGLRSSDTLRPV